LGSSKKLDLEEEIEPESDTILGGVDDLDDADDLDDLSLDEESSGNQVLQSTSKRVRMIFSVMASPNRIDILRILKSQPNHFILTHTRKRITLFLLVGKISSNFVNYNN